MSENGEIYTISENLLLAVTALTNRIECQSKEGILNLITF